MHRPPIDQNRLNSIIDAHKDDKWGLIPLLRAIQEVFGYIPIESIVSIAEAFNVFPVRVQSLVTFYDGFTREPKGKYVLKCCRGTACHVKGSRQVLDRLKSELNLAEGETSHDYQFTLETVTCLGTCSQAPTMMVNTDVFGKLAPNKVASILTQYKKEQKSS